jgi:hypothetical protein
MDGSTNDAWKRKVDTPGTPGTLGGQEIVPSEDKDEITGTQWTSALWSTDGPHDQTSHASEEGAKGVTKRERSVEGTTCASIVENPDTERENAKAPLKDCI